MEGRDLSKRSQSFRAMLAESDTEVQPITRVPAGAVRTLRDTFSEVERENELLRQQIAEGASSVDLDPSTIDPSPFPDRFADQSAEAYKALKASIAESGQEIPILVRPHPSAEGRFQTAYGHRRVRVALDLGIAVKAIVREMNDEKLALAQGLENSPREDLSFIERASFALNLEASGVARAVIQQALSIDRAEVSKLISVAQAIPDWLVGAVGRAPKIGRGRWQELADLLKEPKAEAKAREALEEKAFAHKDTDARFQAVVRHLKRVDTKDAVGRANPVARASDGREIATLTISAKQCRIEIDRKRDEAFADYVMGQLPGLYESFKSRSKTEG